LSTAAEFLFAGAFALGVGSDLVNSKAIADGKPEIVTQTAKEYVEIIRKARAK
jgi:2-dehydro-3-deoxyphosphogluconate aldolase/(4S)-4-hydroxy-2-oxoglutarate aldolase